MDDVFEAHSSNSEFSDGYDVIEEPYHHVARRISDVLRNKSAKPKTVLIDDIENIQQAVRSGIGIDSIYVSTGTSSAVANDMCKLAGNVPAYVLSHKVMGSLFGAEKRSRVFALAKVPRPKQLSDLSDSEGDIVVLDGVRLAGNIGAIIRTSVGFGVSALVLLDSGLKNIFDRRLIRASRGLVFTLPIVLASPGELSDYVQLERMPVGTLAANATDRLDSLGSVPGKMAIILGSERKGVSERLQSIASYRCSIPMSPEIESFNVSVSAGIALYARNRSRCSIGR